MAEAQAPKLVPIRLAQQYTNGRMISFSGRAVAYDQNSVCVLISEQFETGVRLSVMAPFLGGLTRAKVFSVTRSASHPGFFEVFLQIGDEEAATTRLILDNPRPGPPRRTGGRDEQSGRSSQANARSSETNPAPAIPPAAIEAAQQLAREFWRQPGGGICDVLNAVPAHMRATSLLVLMAATVHLLQKKGHVEMGRLLATLKGPVERTAKEAATK